MDEINTRCYYDPDERIYQGHPEWNGLHPTEIMMIEFSKQHVHNALLNASKKARVKVECGEDLNDYTHVVDRDSILNAYPDDQIE